MSEQDKSCVGCKFLFTQGTGYSNYTWIDNELSCAKARNPALPVEEGCDWTKEPDNCPATKAGRCELYAPGEMVCLDVDGEDGPADHTQDEEVIVAICEASGRARKGS